MLSRSTLTSSHASQLVLGIHQGLGILFPTEQLGVEWLRTPHNGIVFGGRPPLNLVTSGSQDGLLLVRRFSTARNLRRGRFDEICLTTLTVFYRTGAI